MKQKYINVWIILITWLVHVVIWGIVYFILSPAPIGLGKFNVPMFNTTQTIYFLSYGFILSAIMFYVYAHIALPSFLKNNRFKYFVMINLVFLIGFTLLESIIDYGFEWLVLTDVGLDIDWKSFPSWIQSNLLINGLFMLAANFYGFTYGWFMDHNRRRSLEKEKLKAELTALKNQINPHFLFNILNGLYGMALKNDDEMTADGIAKLSQMMRYMLYESNDAKVPLEKEIAYLQNYIDLQKIRINGDLTEISFSTSGDISGKQIVPMIFIPFVENAFKHGLSTVKSSYIHISLDLLGNDLSFRVENSVHAHTLPLKKNYGGIGLKNVKKRLALLYTGSYELNINQEDDKYLVHLTLAL